MSDDERAPEDGRSEAQVRMEQEKKKRNERAEEEMAEYEEIRREQREKEAEDIKQLRQRREQRRKEREEEEKRLSELRSEEEKKRRAEDEERIRKKKEEEARKREEREAKRREYEEKSKKHGPNFTINKKAGGAEGEANGEENSEKKPTKSKEQLEAERKVEIEKRYHKIPLSGLGADQLREKAKEIHQMIYHLESEKYDLMKRFEQQNYDMQELAERARQISKGGGKNKPLTNASPDPLAAKFSGIPPKVVMYSQYERVKDHRSFDERSDVFGGPLYSEEYVKIEPTQKIIMTEQGARAVGGEGGDGGHEAPVENGN